jgi:hypothetical protein
MKDTAATMTEETAADNKEFGNHHESRRRGTIKSDDVGDELPLRRFVGQCQRRQTIPSETQQLSIQKPVIFFDLYAVPIFYLGA